MANDKKSAKSGAGAFTVTVCGNTYTLDELIAEGHELALYFDLTSLQDPARSGERMALASALDSMITWQSLAALAAVQRPPRPVRGPAPPAPPPAPAPSPVPAKKSAGSR